MTIDRDRFGAPGMLGIATCWLAGALCATLFGCQKGTDSERRDERRPERPTAPRSDLAQPGAEPFDTQLAARLRTDLKTRGSDYQPRTRHLRSDGAPRYVNRLLLESSPYLQQHAHNPVNWYPWGEEAFADARRLGRMILLSVGYSTCHWCHVMEEESFENVEIARYLNENYIAIKVDREELPDVDSIYMAAVVRSIRRGGWPMTVWLTPELEPIHGETYLPPRTGARGRRTGFLEMLKGFKARYDQDPQSLITQSQELAREIAQMKTPPAGGALPRQRADQLLRSAAAAYQRQFDPRHGGHTGAPKFPSSFPVRLMLRLYRRTGDQRTLEMVEKTLEKMAAGGIYDHIGGGFHRYAVDERWLVPHFEKMLYDNALLTLAYLEGYQVTGRADFASVARDILNYIGREMTSPRGGFYSATDADSKDAAGHLEEGAFFVWTLPELAEALEPEELKIAKMAFAITPGGNFEGKSILHRPLPPDQVAASLQMTREAFDSALEGIKAKLYKVRAHRSPPLRDEKILVAWNGLMISAFARAALALVGTDESIRYLVYAERAAEFIMTDMQNGRGLWRSYKSGNAHVPAYLDDYAFFINGLLDLFEASGKTRYLDRAIALDGYLAEHFEDQRGGGFFLSSAAHDQLLTREKPLRDGAVPSGNSLAARYLLRLYELTTEVKYLQRAERTFSAMASILYRNPLSLSELMIAVEFWTDTAKQVVIISGAQGATPAEFMAVLGKTFAPNAVLSVTTEQATNGPLGDRVPLVRKKIAQRGQTTAYVCEEQVCELPTRDPAVFARLLSKVVPLAE